MEAQASIQMNSFKCPFHPNDTIQRVSLSPKAPFPLFCIECLLNPQIQSLQLPMTNLATFLGEACQHYTTHKTLEPLGSTVPNDFSLVLKTQQNSIAEFTQHIESQKAQVIETANQSLEIIKKHLAQKRGELLQNLDLQLILFKTNLGYYENKINTFYGDKETITLQDQLIQKINNFEGTERFAAFLQQFKDDLQTNQNNLPRSQINKKLKEMSDDIIKQANALSTNSSLVKGQHEILNQITAQILPILSECFTQTSTPAKLICYTDYQGLDLEELVDLLISSKNDIKAIDNIVKQIDKPTKRAQLATISVEKPESLSRLSSMFYFLPDSSLKEKALIIFLSIIQENVADILTEDGHYEVYQDGLSIALESQDERLQTTALISLQIIIMNHSESEFAYKLSSSRSLGRSLSRACSSQYISIRILSQEVMDNLGFDRYEIENDEEYLHDCSNNYSKKPNFEEIFGNSQNYSMPPMHSLLLQHPSPLASMNFPQSSQPKNSLISMMNQPPHSLTSMMSQPTYSLTPMTNQPPHSLISMLSQKLHSPPDSSPR